MTAQTDKPKRTKAARNEIRKIKATYYNNVAVGITITGFWSPIIVFQYNNYAIMKRLQANGYSKFDQADWLTGLAVGWAVIVSLFIASRLHKLAISFLSEIED